MQTLDPRPVDLPGGFLGVDAGPEQRFVRVHVPDSGDQGLVEQCRLDPHPAAGEHAGEVVGREPRRQRLDADPAAPVGPFIGPGGDHPHTTEAPLIAEGERGAVVEGEQGPQKPLLAVRGRPRPPVEASGHPEMEREGVAFVQPQQQILATAVDPLDDLSHDPCGERLGKFGGGDQGVGHVQAVEPPSRNPLRQLTADRFDLRKLGHRDR